MTRQEIEALLRLLVEWARKEISLLMLKRQKWGGTGMPNAGTASCGSSLALWLIV